MKITETGTPHIQEPRVTRIPRSASPKPRSGGFNLGDVFYALYRHKGKIALLGLLGLISGAFVYLNRAKFYESRAKILIPYVVDRGENADSITSAYGREGSLLLNAEMDLIASWDLAEAVAKEAGPETVVAQTGKDVSITAAAGSIMSNLKVEVPKNSTVLHVTYQHPDPEQARSILAKIITQYQIKHKEAHRSTRSFDAVSQKAADAKAVLEADRTKLQNLKKEHNIVSLSGKENALSAQMETLKSEISATETNLAVQQLRVAGAENATKSPGKTPEAAPSGSTGPGAAEMMEYQSSIREIESMNQKKSELKLTYADNSDLVRSAQSMIDAAEKRKLALVTKYPSLSTVVSPSMPAGSAPLDVSLERAALASLEARTQVLKQQKGELDKQLASLLEVGAQINRLERDIKEDEIIYTNYNTDLKKAESDHLLKPSELENISVIQQPSAPGPVSAVPTLKLAAGLGAGGFILGILLAILIELVLDRSIKRPQDVESRINIPLMLSIPLISGIGRSSAGLLEDKETKRSRKSKGAAALPWQNGDVVRPFASAIRDRVGYDFMVTGITHRPKIIGLTGFSQGAGTSTLAVSVASSFAEIASGQVLYVNLNQETAHALPAAGSSELAPGPHLRLIERRGNLSLASIIPSSSTPDIDFANGVYPQESLSRQLLDLIPQLRAGNFEYVVVDMPGFSLTSPTLGLARLMDKILLVIDAGKTDRDLVKRAYDELTTKAHVDVSAILNKSPDNLPAWAKG